LHDFDRGPCRSHWRGHLAETLALRLRQIPTLSPYSEFISFVIVVLVIAYLTLILGELVPKRIALSNPERIALAMASYLGLLTRISSHFVFVLGASSDLIIRIIGIRPTTELPMDEEEIKILIDQGTEAGVIEKAEHIREGRTYYGEGLSPWRLTSRDSYDPQVRDSVIKH